LRQRKEEIEILLQISMHKLAHHYGLPPRGFTPHVLQAAANKSWPGNLTELESFVKRYLFAGEQELSTATMGSNPTIDWNGISSPSTTAAALPRIGNDGGSNPDPKSLKSVLHSVKVETEKNAIAAALDQTRWNRKAAARLLKVSYRTILYKIDQYNMIAPQAYPSTFLRSEIKGNGRVS
jgi:two-component system, NtrC family, response regulator AtoC